MKKITIIGGGASGTLLAANLLRNASQPIEIDLIERSSRFGRGVAYGTQHETHLLNVPTARIGAFPGDEGHFHRWLVEKGHDFGSSDFVPRRLFGDYLRSIFSDAADNRHVDVKLNLIDGEALDMTVDADSADVIMRSGKMVRSDRVVLAFGNFAPPHPNVADLAFTSADRYFRDPWGAGVYDAVAPDDSVFIIGTGLSMVDIALNLKRLNHRGKIFAISTRGLLPARHQLGFIYPSFYDEIKDIRQITGLLTAVRRHIEIAEATGGNWRAVIDSLRPVTQQIWIDLPISEKRYFMQHLSRYWNVARHRMPPAAADAIDEMKADGRMEILKGRLYKIVCSNERFTTSFENNGKSQAVTTDILVNCIGSESNFAKVESQFVRNLIDRGYLRTDELSLGIDASPDGQVIGRDGKTSPVVYTLGTALKGVLWETTAIPEIRTQARALALKLLAD